MVAFGCLPVCVPVCASTSATLRCVALAEPKTRSWMEGRKVRLVAWGGAGGRAGGSVGGDDTRRCMRMCVCARYVPGPVRRGWSGLALRLSLGRGGSGTSWLELPGRAGQQCDSRRLCDQGWLPERSSRRGRGVALGTERHHIANQKSKSNRRRSSLCTPAPLRPDTGPAPAASITE